MFTGIVQAIGCIAAITPTPAGRRLVVDRQGWQPRGITLSHGDSICVSGVCLTLVAFDEKTFAFDVIQETLDKTRLGSLMPGDRVNLEPSLTASTPMGGHFVQGHVDGLAAITRIDTAGGQWRITLTPVKQLMAYIIPKGSITLDGVSLTIASVTDKTFDVALIPATLEATTLSAAEAGDTVNLETDILSRTIVHHLQRMTQQVEAGGVTMDTLRKAGFIR